MVAPSFAPLSSPSRSPSSSTTINGILPVSMDCPQPSQAEAAQQRGNQKDDLVSRADALGMSASCKQAMTTSYDAESTSGALSASAQAGWGAVSAGVSASFATGSQNADSTQTAEGCQSMVANIINQVNAQESIRCNLSTTNVKNNSSVSANATISIKQKDADQCGHIDRTAILNFINIQTTRRHEILAQMLDRGVSQRAIDAFQKIHQDSLAMMAQTMGQITIKDSTISNAISSLLESDTQVKSSTTRNIKNSMIATAAAEAENVLTQTAGTGAVSGATRSYIDSQVQNRNSDFETNIEQIQTEQNTTSVTNGNIEIHSCNGVSIENTIIDNKVEARLKASQLTDIARKTGIEIASDMIAESTSTSDTTNTNQGLNDLAEQLGVANASLAEHGTSGAEAAFRALQSLDPSMMAIAAAFVVILLMVLKR